jgi:glycosyltransferase involved in cell wall biosynthesis
MAVAAALARKGYQVDLLVLDDPGSLNAAGPLRIIRPAKSHTLAAISKPLAALSGVHYASSLVETLPSLIAYLKAQRPAAMIAFGGASAAILARKLSGVHCRAVIATGAMISYLTEGSSGLRSNAQRHIMRRLLRAADCIIACSRGVARDIFSLGGVDFERVRVIYNPVVGLDFYRRAEEPVDHSWFANPASPVVLAAGELIKHKDFTTLIRAFAIVAAARDAKLVILGEGLERPRLQELVSQLGLSASVDMPGYQQNPYKFMRRASVFVSSSVSEAFGNVIAEALAVGTPVVATECAGPAEILDHGRFGRLVPMRDPDALAKAILETIETPPDRDNLRARGSDFAIEKILPLYIEALGLPSVSDRMVPTPISAAIG